MADDAVSVLVVDDQLPFRMAAKTVVRVTPGFEVVGEAETGEEAVTQVDALHPRLVLMDINMPGINGIEASRRIHEAHPDVCVVLLSTYPADDLPADALAQGAAAYINKDEFGPQVLRSTWDGSGPNGDAPRSTAEA
ncbi:MAG TPA: response regulator transcription factor [Acidimicrobiales bacterium]|nr:response regulator transcription factor [Acidimicrobiales bacterium]